MGKKGKKNKRQQGEAAALRHYLLAIDTIGKTILNPNNPSVEHFGAARVQEFYDEIINEAWLRSREARIFVLEADAWDRMYTGSIHLINKIVCGYAKDILGYDEDPFAVPPSDKQAKEMVGVVEAFADAVDLPEQLPFEDMWLAFGGGVRVPKPEWSSNLPQVVEAQRGDLKDVWMLAYLVTCDSNGEPIVLSVYRIIRGDGRDGYAWQTVFCHGGWTSILVPDFMIVPSIIEALNSFRTYILERRAPISHTYDRKQIAKKACGPLPPPKPYYTINLRNTLINQAAAKNAEARAEQLRRPPSHRYDVRGHEVCRIVREPLPIDPGVVAGLRARGYNVYIDGHVSPEDQARLDKRLVDPKSPHEMLAILTTWRPEHIRGPKDAPYVPSIRLVPTEVN